jgi:hypothetical protein
MARILRFIPTLTIELDAAELRDDPIDEHATALAGQRSTEAGERVEHGEPAVVLALVRGSIDAGTGAQIGDGAGRGVRDALETPRAEGRVRDARAYLAAVIDETLVECARRRGGG